MAVACLLGFTYSAWAVYGVAWKPAVSGLGLMACGLLVYLAMWLGSFGNEPAAGKPGTVEER